MLPRLSLTNVALILSSDSPTTAAEPPPPVLVPPQTATPINPSGHRASPSAPMSHHRQSWSQDLRGVPSSPNRQRHPSVSHQALQELFTNPPAAHKGDNHFAGRDWRSITVSEIVDPDEVRFAEFDTSVEDATNVRL